MKKSILLIIVTIVASFVKACPPPTSHAIIKTGAVYIHDLPSVNSEANINNLGVYASLGIETPKKYSTISVETMCINLKDNTNWGIGLSYGLNPLGVMYNSPINFRVVCGVGYVSTNSIYGNVGLQIEFGQTSNWLTPYVLVNVGLTDKIDGVVNCNYGVATAIGLKLRIGSKYGW